MEGLDSQNGKHWNEDGLLIGCCTKLGRTRVCCGDVKEEIHQGTVVRMDGAGKEGDKEASKPKSLVSRVPAVASAKGGHVHTES